MSTAALLPVCEGIPKVENPNQTVLAPNRPRAWRGCIGLALVCTDPATGHSRGPHFFVHNRHLCWLSVVDISATGRRRDRSRCLPWASWHMAETRFSMPVLGRRAEGVAQVAKDTMHGRDRPPGKSVKDLREIFRDLDDSLNKASCVGRPREHDSQKPSDWMPRPYLGFRMRHFNSVFEWSTRLADGQQYYPIGLKAQLCVDVGQALPVQAPCTGTFVGSHRSTTFGLPTLDLVFKGKDQSRHVAKVTRQATLHLSSGRHVREGDLVANDGIELPAQWHRLSLRDQWRHLQQQWRVRFQARVRLWFNRQATEIIPGLVHLPAELAAVAARDQSWPAELQWDLGPALPFYHEARGAFIFPPLWTRRQFIGRLPGQVAFDFTPNVHILEARPASNFVSTFPARKHHDRSY